MKQVDIEQRLLEVREGIYKSDLPNIKKQKEKVQKKPHNKAKNSKLSPISNKQTSPKKQSYQHKKHL